METLLSLPIIGPFLSVAAPFLLVLGVVIFVHEYGHYIVGRWSGIHAEVFSIGFGPEIVGWDDRRGTRWRLCWVPLGGYVKFKGDADAASGPDAEAVQDLSPEERRTTLQGAPLWARAATVAAGPIANFILTILIVFALALALGRPSDAPVLGEVAAGGQAYGGGLRAGDRIISVDGEPIETYRGFLEALYSDEARPKQVVVERQRGEGDAQAVYQETLALTFARLTKVARVRGGAPAAFACVKAGDVIQKVDGRGVASASDIQAAIAQSEDKAIILTLERGGELVETELTPEWLEEPDPQTGGVTRNLRIGVEFDFNIGVQPSYEPMGVGEAAWSGLTAPYRIAALTFGYLGSIFSGQSDGSSLAGPLGIADLSGQAAAQGLVAFINLIALLSAAIGLMNLLPIPILDGGHLVFYGIEAVRGRPLHERYVEAAMTAGFVAILALLVFATSNDVQRLFGAMASGC